MNIGIIGIGKMGFNIGLNLARREHIIHVYDVNEENLNNAKKEGMIPHFSLKELVETIPTPRVIWIMVPAGEAVDETIENLIPLVSMDDIVIDAGNSHYQDSIRRYKQLKQYGIHFIDVGTSGGISGAQMGACTMIGGDQDVFNQILPLIKAISLENGYLYTGPVGSGHFLKMIHNGIEYGMMQAIAEGFEILESSPYDYDFEAVARVWNHGSVIRSWLMELMEDAFKEDPKLERIKGVMHSSGEGKWTIETALDLQVPAPVITLSQLMRYRSLQEDTFSGKVVATLRNQFGGHDLVLKEQKS